MKVRFIFTTPVQVGIDVWVQRYETKDIEVPDDFVPEGFTTVGVSYCELERERERERERE